MASHKRLLAVADHPARAVVSAFVAAIAIGTALLILPWSSSSGQSLGFQAALFTSTSAVCVTGLSVVDAGTHFSGFGQAILLLLMQLGGLGFMTIASLIAIVVSRHLGLRMTLLANRERSALSLGDVRRVLRGVAFVTVMVEVVVSVVLAGRFWFGYHYRWDKALWHGVFHGVAGFTNAGFSLYPDSLERFSTDVIVLAPLAISVVVGGLGFPVLVDLYTHRHDRKWRGLTLHSRLTLAMTAILLVVGCVAIGAAEWTNPATFGSRGAIAKATMSVFGSITPRTAGFSVVPIGEMSDEGLFATMVLMFIGAGSAGTSGGIKISTAAVLGLVVWSQLRGRSDVGAFGRRISERATREATTVVILAAGAVFTATVVLLATTTSVPLTDALFEAISAFGTAGLSTGITPTLSHVAQFVLIFTMLIGRLGPVTLGMALVLNRREARVRYPEEDPLIG